jgi:hypothetical protein
VNSLRAFRFTRVAFLTVVGRPADNSAYFWLWQSIPEAAALRSFQAPNDCRGTPIADCAIVRVLPTVRPCLRMIRG